MIARIFGRVAACWTAALVAGPAFAAPPTPDYDREIAPLLRKYCGGCHNAADREGKFSTESYTDLMRGGEHGPAVAPGSSESSRMLRLMLKQADPQMPPEDEPQPSADELALVRRWIDGGAKGPAGSAPERRELLVPDLQANVKAPAPLTALRFAPDGRTLAAGRYRTAELLDAVTGRTLRTFEGAAGKVQRLLYLDGGKSLLAVSGVPGLHGEIRLWESAPGRTLRAWNGHRDAIYAAALSPDGTLLATAGYDRDVLLWDLAAGKVVRTFKGHNDAIYDLAFHRDGAVLASASGDATIKLWQTATGVRLDTLSQPTKEQFSAGFTGDGDRILATGADNRIRVWEFVSRTKPLINPPLVSRFAHEGPITQMAVAPTGGLLATASEDGVVKFWSVDGFTEVGAIGRQPDLVAALAFSPDGTALAVGRMNGSLDLYAAPKVAPRATEVPAENAVAAEASTDEPTPSTPDPAPVELAEQEPNDAPERAQTATLPFKAIGKIQTAGDADLYRFTAKQGEEWVFETFADRKKSPLDSKLEILHADGRPVERLKLQAVRDSYITFRGIESGAREVRLFNWEEMELNQFLYFQGEVCKLHRAPRGPDSGFQLYPDEGPRKCYFDTSADAHALHEPCYIVEPLPADAVPIPNGLPVFTLYYRNDDDGLRRSGKDSRLTFTAPKDGEYLVRISDVRKQAGDKYTYELLGRRARPDFAVRLKQNEWKINRGSGRSVELVVDRKDGFEGEVSIALSGLPAGFEANTPVTVQADHEIAFISLRAAADAAEPSDEDVKKIRFTAKARIGGREIVRQTAGPKSLKLEAAPKIHVMVLAAPDRTEFDPGEIVIRPGETVNAVVRVERKNFEPRLTFEAFNLPHGIIVDNIGLNGVLIPEKQTERVVQLTAAKWVPEQTRRFFFQSNEEGKQATAPIVIRVVRPDPRTARSEAGAGR